MNRTDTFIRANNPTSLGTPSDGGTPWVTVLGTWGILSNQAYLPIAGGNDHSYLETGESDGTLEITVNSGTLGVGGIFRYNVAGDCILFDLDSTTIDTYEKVGGSFTLKGSAAVTVAYPFIIKAVFASTAIDVYYNSTLLYSFTSSVNVTETKVGMWSSGDLSPTWSLFTFTGGTPPPPSTNRGLIPNDFTYWEYKAATGTSLSRLTFWMVPRNVLLYDAAADAALIYLQAHTPAALQF